MKMLRTVAVVRVWIPAYWKWSRRKWANPGRERSDTIERAGNKGNLKQKVEDAPTRRDNTQFPE